MDELRRMIAEMLRDAEIAGDVLSYSPIDGEPATFGVELPDGDLLFVSVVSALGGHHRGHYGVTQTGTNDTLASGSEVATGE
jgi:hypothetical protein